MEQDDQPYAAPTSLSDSDSLTQIPAEGMPIPRRLQIQAVATMYLGYAMFMVLRMAPGVAGAKIINDASMGISKGDWGRILAAGTTGAVLGKIIGGIASDRFNCLLIKSD